jgi:hypothetical protein
MASSVKRLGNHATREAPESREITVTDAGASMTIIQRGLYSALESALPKAGDAFPGIAGMIVERANLRRGKGGLGTLVTSLVPKSAEGGELTPTSVEWEVAMERLEKPLFGHPNVNGYTGQLAAWEATDAELRAQLKYRDESREIQPLTGKAADFAAKKLRGQESYLRCYPVVRKVSVYSGKPAVGAGMNTIQTPAETAKGDWEYLKTGDSRSSLANGKWRRTEEWTGAEKWDPDLYAQG